MAAESDMASPHVWRRVSLHPGEREVFRARQPRVRPGASSMRPSRHGAGIELSAGSRTTSDTRECAMALALSRTLRLILGIALVALGAVPAQAALIDVAVTGVATTVGSGVAGT